LDNKTVDIAMIWTTMIHLIPYIQLSQKIYLPQLFYMTNGQNCIFFLMQSLSEVEFDSCIVLFTYISLHLSCIFYWPKVVNFSA